MINLFLFLAFFIPWLYFLIKNSKPTWCIYVLSFMCGAFFIQTIFWICGIPTIIENLTK